MWDSPGISIPPSIERLENLEELFLPVADSKSLPEEFGNLKNLKILELSGGSNTKLPESIKNIERLTYLDLRNADKSCDFGIVKELKNLKFLRIGRSGIEGREQDLHDNVLNLVKGSNFLGHVDFGQKGSPELEYALACKRFESEIHCAGDHPYEELHNLCQNLWPRMLSKVDSMFGRRRFWRGFIRNRYYRGERDTHLISSPGLAMQYICFGKFDEINPHDAVYKLLVEGRETFLEILHARNNRSSESDSKSESDTFSESDNEYE